MNESLFFCRLENGSCLAWAHNMETKRCAGWMLESQLETRENDKSSSDDGNDAEGNIVAKDKNKGDSEDDDAKASVPSKDDIVFDFDDDQESTTQTYYSSFYNTEPEARRTESHDEDEDSTAEEYYSDFYNVQTQSGGRESDDDDGGSSGYSSFAGYDYSSPVTHSEEESHDDGAEMTAQEYYNAFYNFPAGSVRTDDDDDDGSTMMYGSFSGYDYDYDSPGSNSSDLVEGTSNSTSIDLHSNMTSRALKEQKSDPARHTLISNYISLNRGSLYDQCEVIATVTFITPANSVSSTMSDCFFQKVELIKSTTKEQCNAVCQNCKESFSSNQIQSVCL